MSVLQWRIAGGDDVIELHLVGYTAELGHLVVDLAGADGGRYRLVVDADLFATVDELREQRRDRGLPVGDLVEFADELGLPLDELQRVQADEDATAAAAGHVSAGSGLAGTALERAGDDAPGDEPPGREADDAPVEEPATGGTRLVEDGWGDDGSAVGDDGNDEGAGDDGDHADDGEHADDEDAGDHRDGPLGGGRSWDFDEGAHSDGASLPTVDEDPAGWRSADTHGDASDIGTVRVVASPSDNGSGDPGPPPGDGEQDGLVTRLLDEQPATEPSGVAEDVWDDDGPAVAPPPPPPAPDPEPGRATQDPPPADRDPAVHADEDEGAREAGDAPTDPDPAPASLAVPSRRGAERRQPPRPLVPEPSPSRRPPAPAADRPTPRPRRDRAAPDRPEPALSPAEIQARLRAGASVRSVARAAGVDAEWIRRWEAPIEAERRRVLERARQLRIERARLGRSAHPLGEAVARNLRSRGVGDDDVAWEVSRRRDGRWRVAVRYVSRGRKRSATWTYDAEDQVLAPASDNAREVGFTRRRRR